MTDDGEEEGKDTHSNSIFNQFQTVIKFWLIQSSLRGKRILFVLSLTVQKHMKRNNRAICKRRIEMGKIAVNSQFLFWGRIAAVEAAW